MPSRATSGRGFDSPADVHRLIDDLLEGDADEALLRAAVGPEFARKAAAEATWPPTTDCDRLDAAFETLNAHGIIALPKRGLHDVRWPHRSGRGLAPARQPGRRAGLLFLPRPGPGARGEG